MVNATKHAAAQTAKAICKAKKDALMVRRIALANKFHAEMNAVYGPFPENEKGAYDLMCAMKRDIGKTVGDMVLEALAK